MKVGLIFEKSVIWGIMYIGTPQFHPINTIRYYFDSRVYLAFAGVDLCCSPFVTFSSTPSSNVFKGICVLNDDVLILTDVGSSATKPLNKQNKYVTVCVRTKLTDVRYYINRNTENSANTA